MVNYYVSLDEVIGCTDSAMNTIPEIHIYIFTDKIFVIYSLVV